MSGPMPARTPVSVIRFATVPSASAVTLDSLRRCWCALLALAVVTLGALVPFGAPPASAGLPGTYQQSPLAVGHPGLGRRATGQPVLRLLHRGRVLQHPGHDHRQSGQLASDPPVQPRCQRSPALSVGERDGRHLPDQCLGVAGARQRRPLGPLDDPGRRSVLSLLRRPGTPRSGTTASGWPREPIPSDPTSTIRPDRSSARPTWVAPSIPTSTRIPPGTYYLAWKNNDGYGSKSPATLWSSAVTFDGRRCLAERTDHRPHHPEQGMGDHHRTARNGRAGWPVAPVLFRWGMADQWLCHRLRRLPGADRPL